MPAFDPTATNAAEKKVLAATAIGEWARFTATEPRTLRATFLRHLLLALADCAGPEGAALPVLALARVGRNSLHSAVTTPRLDDRISEATG